MGSAGSIHWAKTASQRPSWTALISVGNRGGRGAGSLRSSVHVGTLRQSESSHALSNAGIDFVRPALRGGSELPISWGRKTGADSSPFDGRAGTLAAGP